jgi:large repetitive protein
MRKIIFSIVLILISALVIAQPGKDGTLTVTSSTQIVNQYAPISTSISAGSNTLSLATTSIISLCQGDLIMVYQAQGASMSSTNAVGYGSITAYNSAGLYEFEYVQSVAGNIITTQTTFTNSYDLAGRPQVIKVPQYSTLTINPGSSIIPKPWKDTTIAAVPYRFGGLVVIHASNIINNGAIQADGSGFRGGANFYSSGITSGVTSFVSALNNTGGEKGESIFGDQTDYDSNGGRYCMGAPANGGGGGNGHNAGGGGGANGFNSNVWTGEGVMIVNMNNPLVAWSLSNAYSTNGNAPTNSSGGGRGGYSWGNNSGNPLTQGPNNLGAWGGDGRREVGGFGGRPLNNINADTRIYFGGGGGAPHSDNSPSTAPGGNGGGIVYLIATVGIAGSGSVSTTGASGGISSGCNCDGSPGGGAGGSIVIKTPAIVASQTVIANGGNGGSQLVPNTIGSTLQSEGPGGGGGGGLAAISSGGVVPFINGGLNGVSGSPSVAQMISNGATQGASGQTLSVSSSFISFVPIYTVSSNSPQCAGSSINFSTTSALSYTWAGPNAFSSALQNPIITNATTPMAGIYTVSTTYTGNCAGSLTQTIAVVVNPSPTLGVSNSVVCPGGTGTLIASGAVSYTWNPGALVGNSLTINPLATTAYTVTGASAFGCTTNVVRVVTVPSSMTVNITASSSTACVGRSINLTASTSGGNPAYSYTWTSGPFTANYSVSRPAGSYIYTVTSRDFNGCTASRTATVSFIAPPVLSVSSISICPLSSGTLTASGATSYTWNPGNVVSNPFFAAPLISSSYTAIGSAQGCTASATASITLKPLPSLSFLTASITCATLGSATVSASGGLLGPFSYSWTPSAQTTSIAVNLNPGVYTLSVFDAGSACTSISTTTFTSLIPFTGTLSATNSLVCNGQNTGTAAIVVSGGSGKQSYSWTYLAGTQTTSIASGLSSGSYTVSVTDSVTFCNVTQTFFIAQPPALTLNVTQSTPLACVGASIYLSASLLGGIPPYNFLWSSGPGSPGYNVTQSTGGSYVYSVNVSDANNCKDSTNVSVNFVDPPVLTPYSSTVCNGGVATLSVTSNASAYLWSPGGFTGNVIFVTATSNTTYSVIGNRFGCLSNPVTVSVTVNPNPVPNIFSSNNVCEGNPLSFNTANIGNYQWVGPNSFSQTIQNPVINSASLTSAGVYSLTVTDSNGCSASTTTLITIYQNPVISAIGASVCIGSAATLSASGGSSYLWIGPNNYNYNQANAFIPVVNNNSSGPYSVIVTNTITSCSSSTVVQVVGYNFPLPTPSINATSKICLNSTINIKGNGGDTYLWNGPANFVSTDQTLNFSVSSLNMAGIYTLTVKNESNCAASATVLISVYALPNATVNSSRDKTCVPLCTDFNLTPGSNIAPIKKTTYVVESLFISDTAFSYCIQKGGNRLISAFFTDTNGCVNSSTLQLTVYPQPIADFEYFPQKPVENIDNVIFTNTSLGSKLTKWQWYFSENGGYKSESDNTNFLFENAGTYPVVMVVSNSWGCSDTVVKSIVVDEDFSLYVPNSFSPNDDGKNEIFQPKGINIVSYQLQIFDRWGIRIFSTNDFLNGWDGSFNGAFCENGIYVWKIEATNSRGTTKNLAGTVTVIR